MPPIEKKLLPKGQRQRQANKLKTEIDTAVAKGLEAIEQADEDISDKKRQGFYLEIKLSDAPWLH